MFLFDLTKLKLQPASQNSFIYSHIYIFVKVDFKLEKWISFVLSSSVL